MNKETLSNLINSNKAFAIQEIYDGGYIDMYHDIYYIPTSEEQVNEMKSSVRNLTLEWETSSNLVRVSHLGNEIGRMVPGGYLVIAVNKDGTPYFPQYSQGDISSMSFSSICTVFCNA